MPATPSLRSSPTRSVANARPVRHARSASSPADAIRSRIVPGMSIPGTSLCRNAAWRPETRGSTPAITGTSRGSPIESFVRLPEHAERLERVDRLGEHEARARGDLASQQPDLALEVGRRR